MSVDVQTQIEIDRPRSEVSAYAADPDTATFWYENIEAVEWKTPKPFAVGSRIAFVARFLGRRLAYTYEIRELVPGVRLVMSTADGPFPMETTYAWEDTADGGTRMTLRNRGSRPASPPSPRRSWPGRCAAPTGRISFASRRFWRTARARAEARGPAARIDWTIARA